MPKDLSSSEYAIQLKEIEEKYGTYYDSGTKYEAQPEVEHHEYEHYT